MTGVQTCALPIFRISFKMKIGDLVDSQIMQLYPFSFAREMCDSYAKTMEVDTEEVSASDDVQSEGAESSGQDASQQQAMPEMDMEGMMNQQMMNPQMMNPQMMNPQMMNQMMFQQQPVNVQPAQFSPFAGQFAAQFAKENIDLIMDVPLEVTVELGRVSKSISEILDFAPGTIIELDRIAGEPIDVLVNGKFVAKGEVVVIEESFGVRITEIVK